MAENFYSSLWDFEDLMYVSVTGMFLQDASVRLKVGEHPKLDFTICINRFLQQLSEEELDKLQSLIKKLQISKLVIKEPKEVLVQIGNEKPKGSGWWVVPP